MAGIKLVEAERPEPAWHAMILIALRTGLRIGELRALRWQGRHALRSAEIGAVRRKDRTNLPPAAPTGFPAGCTPGSDCLFVPSAGVTVTLGGAVPGWNATATHTAATPGTLCADFIGAANVIAPATVEGEPKCQ